MRTSFGPKVNMFGLADVVDDARGEESDGLLFHRHLVDFGVLYWITPRLVVVNETSVIEGLCRYFQVWWCFVFQRKQTTTRT